MSMKIDQSRIDSGDLTDEEIMYLQQRGRLPAHVAPLVRGADGEWIGRADPYSFFDQIPLEILEEAVAVRKQRMLEDAERNTPKIEDKGGIVESYDDEDEDDEEVAYEKMTNKELRALLANRGLSVEGKKDDFIARLTRSDEGRPEPEDFFSI